VKNKFTANSEVTNANRIVTASNIISLLRAFLAIPIVYFFREGKGNISLVLILIAIISDMLDGWLARISNEITDIGKILDPVADKVVVFSIVLYLLLGRKIPLYYFGILAIRDLSIAIMGIYVINNCKVTPQSNKVGKVSIIFVFVTLLSFLFEEKFGRFAVPLMWISIVLMVVSWVQYCFTYISQIQLSKVKSTKDLSGVVSESAKLKSGLKKTGQDITSGLPLLKKFSKVDEQTLGKIEETLITADVSVELTEELIDRLRKVDRASGATLEEILRDEIKSILTDEVTVEKERNVKPYVILFVGVNGTGKTTAIGKIAARFKKEGKNVLLVAADTFRAAAYDQLEIWAKRSGAEFIGNPQGKDPSAVVFDAIKSAVSRESDVVLIDTAGRLHTKSNLMEELSKIRRTIAKLIRDAPHDIWLVLDATTGQNGIVQAEEFTKKIGVTGIVLTKLDGTARGGVVLSIARNLKIPVKYVGIGEGIDDIVEFNSNLFVDALFSNN
jgi:fused signal recognition particle receptor